MQHACARQRFCVCVRACLSMRGLNVVKSSRPPITSRAQFLLTLASYHCPQAHPQWKILIRPIHLEKKKISSLNWFAAKKVDAANIDKKKKKKTRLVSSDCDTQRHPMTAQGWFCKAPLQMFSMSFIFPPGRIPSTSYTSAYLGWATASKTPTCPQSSCENHRIGDKLRFCRLCQANRFAEPRQLNVGVGPECIPVRSHTEVLSPAVIGTSASI